MLVLRRMRAHRAVLGAITVVAFLVAATATAVLGVLDAQSTGGVRAIFAAASGDARQITVRIQVTQDPEAQDAAVRRVVGGITGGIDITRVELPHSPADPLRAQWTLEPAASVRSTDVVGIAALHDALPFALSDEPAVGSTGADVGGGLSDTAAGIVSSVVAAAAVAPIALLLVLVIGIVAIVEPLRLLLRVRAAETVLLRSRGAAAPMLAGAAAAELAMLVIPAAALGAAAAALVVGLWIGTPVNVWTAVLAGGAVAMLAVALGASFTGHEARRALTRSSANDSGRAGQVVALSVTGLLLVGAAFTIWRFVLHDPASGADPIGFLAVPVTLLAVAALALVAFTPIAGLWSATAGGARGLPRALGARQLARRSSVYATMILILGLAAGGLVVAAGYGGTSTAATAQQREIQVGADLRVTVPADGSLSPATTRTLPGVTGATPLLAADIEYAGAAGSLVSSGAAAELPKPLLPAGQVRLVVDASPAAAMPADAILRVMNQDTGEYREVTLQGTAAGPVGTLPEGQWSLLGIEIRLAPLADSVRFQEYLDSLIASGRCQRGAQCVVDPLQVPPAEYRVVITGVAAGGTTVAPGDGWSKAKLSSGGNGWGMTVDPTLPALGVTGTAIPALDGATFDFTRQTRIDAGITVTQALADRTGLAVGDPVSLPFAHTGSGIDGHVTAIVDAIPGMSAAVAASVDLAAFNAQQITTGRAPLPATQLLIATGDPAATTAALRQRYGDAIPILSAGLRPVDTITASSRNALWVAAFGAIALAVVAVAGVAGALVAARRGEGIVLRALGMTAGAQGGVVAGEFAAPVLFALVLGAVGGGLVTWFLVPALAASAVADGIAGFAVPASFEWLPLGIGFGAAVIALGVVVAGVGAAVRRAAGRALGGELR